MISKPGALFIGPLPPPHHGQAASTLDLLTRLLEDGVALKLVDTNDGPGSKLSGVVNRMMRHLKAAANIAKHSQTSVYVSVNANAGMILTAALAGLARRRGHNIILHHHTRGHLQPGHKNLGRLVKAAGSDAVHICICPSMAEDLMRAAPGVQATLAYSNVNVVDSALRQLPLKTMPPAHERTLGHLSNLTIEKGLERVIECFRIARNSGKAKRLIVAGPLGGPREKALVSESAVEFGSDFEWLGPIYGDAKRDFFKMIDVFLFPSLYKHETQGIVNLEALASGCPVAAYAICCISSDLQGSAAVAIPSDRDFPSEAMKFLDSLDASAPIQARGRFDELLTANVEQYNSIKAALEDR